MSARHRHHKARIRETERDLEDNEKDEEAAKRVRAYLLEHGHDEISVAVHTLDHVLIELQRDRIGLLAIMSVLAPDEWRWRVHEQRRALP